MILAKEGTSAAARNNTHHTAVHRGHGSSARVHLMVWLRDRLLHWLRLLQRMQRRLQGWHGLLLLLLLLPPLLLRCRRRRRR